MNEDLRKWFKERWVDISRKKKSGGHPECGASADKGVRAKDSSRKYPKCVPASKAKSMSKKQKQSAVRRKRQQPNKPGSPDNVKTDVKKENWEKWRPRSEEIYSRGYPSNNSPADPEPMGGAVAFERNRKRVLADLKEAIRLIVIDVLNEARDTGAATPAALRRGIAPASTPSQEQSEGLPYESQLRNLFDQEPNINVLNQIANIFRMIMVGREVEEYAELIDELAEAHPEFNEKIRELVPWLDPEFRFKSEEEQEKSMDAKTYRIVKAWSTMARSVEPIVGAKHIENLLATQAATTPGPETADVARKRTIAKLDLPTQSSKFIKDVGDLRKLVQQHIANPVQRERILNGIQNIQFDPEIPEYMKEPMIKSMMRNVSNVMRNVSNVMRNVTGTRHSQLNERLSKKIKDLIIISVLKEQGIYG
jgi:hypothetical protein